MTQLEQDLLYLEDIKDRIFHMSQNLAGTYDTTELEVEKRAAIYRAGDRVNALIMSLKNLQKILKKETMT
jgi:hypothetical protein